jgi:hypothetical protein
LEAHDGVRHPAHDRHRLSVCGVSAEAGVGARRPDRHQAAHARAALPDGGQPLRRQQGDSAGADPLLGAQGRPVVAGGDRAEHRPLVAGGRGPRHERRRPNQPAARLLGIEPMAAGPLHNGLGFRLLRQLVGTPAQDARGDDGLAVRQPGHDGAGRALRDRGKFVHPDRLGSAHADGRKGKAASA